MTTDRKLTANMTAALVALGDNNGTVRLADVNTHAAYGLETRGLAVVRWNALLEDGTTATLVELTEAGGSAYCDAIANHA